MLGAHLLLFSLALFGMRLAGTSYYDVRLLDGATTLFASSEWAIDFWIGPFAVGIAIVALGLVLLTTFPRRWAEWRGAVVLIAGSLIVLAVLLFKLVPPPSTSTLSRDAFATSAINHTSGNETINLELQIFSPYRAWVPLTREPANGWALSLIAGFLLTVGGGAMLKHAGTTSAEPRLSRVALWGAIGPPLFVVSTMCILIIEVTHAEERHGDVVLGLGWSFAFSAAAVAVTIMGAIAIWQIKRSGGKLYGLRLAAVEAILFPLFLLCDLVGLGVFWLGFGLLVLAAPHQVPSVGEGMQSAGVVVPLVLIAIAAALAVSFFAGRSAWRASSGDPPWLPGSMWAGNACEF